MYSFNIPLVSALSPILIGVGTKQSLCILLWNLMAWGPQFITESDLPAGENPGCNEGGIGREITDGMGEAQGLARTKRRCLTQLGYIWGVE